MFLSDQVEIDFCLLIRHLYRKIGEFCANKQEVASKVAKERDRKFNLTLQKYEANKSSSFAFLLNSSETRSS